jgi:hypothetical protein
MTKFLTCAALIAAALFETGSNSLAKQAAIFTATFLALICISSPLMAAEASPEPAGFDILGMKLGMSVAEIETAIKAHNPQLNISMDEIGTDYGSASANSFNALEPRSRTWSKSSSSSP